MELSTSEGHVLCRCCGDDSRGNCANAESRAQGLMEAHDWLVVASRKQQQLKRKSSREQPIGVSVFGGAGACRALIVCLMSAPTLAISRAQATAARAHWPTFQTERTGSTTAFPPTASGPDLVSGPSCAIRTHNQMRQRKATGFQCRLRALATVFVH